MRIVVGLSGGVDSSVAAYLLKKQGHEVIGLFMRNWNDAAPTLEDDCPWIEDSTDAMLVAEKLNIPFQVVDLSSEYKERIVDYMFHEYSVGRTPNPDVLCNREIKFDLFLKIAIELGAEAVATGHYCRKKTITKNNKTLYQLFAGKDSNKDQSYFLCQLNQKQLSYALFPLGDMQKPEVRELAKEIGLENADKKDSQGLCFIGKVSLPTFLQQKLSPKPGEIIEIPNSDTIYPSDADVVFVKKHYKKEMGEIVGKHNGAHYFTKGQRKGIAVGGKAEPLFVLDTDIAENVVYVGQGKSHRGLYRKGLYIKNEYSNWIREDLVPSENKKLKVLARIRYRQKLESAMLWVTNENTFLAFDNSQFAIAEGQFAAWYLDDELVGSGTIEA